MDQFFIHKIFLTDKNIMPIFDWYLLLTPLFALSIVLTLFVIKQSIKTGQQTDIETLAKAKQQQELNKTIQGNKNATENNQQQQVKIQSSQFMITFGYFMRNHSFLELCIIRSAKNKLTMLLAFSTIAVLCFAYPSLYLYSIVGVFLVFAFVLAESFFEVDPVDPLAGQQQQFNLAAVKQGAYQQQRMERNNKILYVVFGVLSCGLGLLSCGLVYRNYTNSVLSALFINLMVNFVLDLFVVRPIGFFILSFPLKLNLKIQTHIKHQNLRQQFANVSLAINTQNCAVNNLSPKKRKNVGSPTKVPRAIPKFQQNENGLTSALEHLKKIKKQKRGCELMTPLSRRNQVEDQSSGMGLQQYALKNLLQKEGQDLNTPIHRFNYDENEQNKVEGKRKDSELVIVQFKKNEQQNQKQDQEGFEGESPNKNFIHTNLDLDDLPDYMTRNKSTIRAEGDEHRNQDQINVIKLVNVNKDGDFQGQYDSKNDRRDSFMTLQNKNRLMSIDENGDDRQIEEIDLNSPEKRRNLQTIFQEAAEDPKYKKKAKHFQSNAKKRVIKFTSGQPYLEYLPKMLAKEHNKHTKRSQPINYKNDLENLQEKPRKSLNKIKAPKHDSVLFGGDENECPQAIEIEDL